MTARSPLRQGTRQKLPNHRALARPGRADQLEMLGFIHQRDGVPRKGEFGIPTALPDRVAAILLHQPRSALVLHVGLHAGKHRSHDRAADKQKYHAEQFRGRLG